MAADTKDRARQTVLLVDTHGTPSQLPVAETVDEVTEALECEGLIRFHHPLGGDGFVVVSSYHIVAFWDQAVEVVVDPRVFGQNRTASGLELPPRAA